MKNYIKQKLTENLVYEVIESYLEEDYPSNFDLEEFSKLNSFNKRIRYCEERLKRISSGSSRIVYMIDNTKVLKIAKNKKGLAQNEVEIQWGGDSYFESILAQTFSYDLNDLWVEMELARKVTKKDFQRITGCSIEDMDIYLRNFYDVNHGRRPMFRIDPQLKEALDENEFVQQIQDFMANIDAPSGDFAKLSSYGIVQRNGQDDIVLIDFGLNNDVYQSYYK